MIGTQLWQGYGDGYYMHNNGFILPPRMLIAQSCDRSIADTRRFSCCYRFWESISHCVVLFGPPVSGRLAAVHLALSRVQGGPRLIDGCPLGATVFAPQSGPLLRGIPGLEGALALPAPRGADCLQDIQAEARFPVGTPLGATSMAGNV